MKKIMAPSHVRKPYNIPSLGIVHCTEYRYKILMFFENMKEELKGKKKKILIVGAGKNKTMPTIFKGHDVILSDDTTEYGNIGIDIMKVPTKDQKEKYDIVICPEKLAHVFEPIKACKNLVKLLKKGGILIITSPFNRHIIKNETMCDYYRLTGDFFEEVYRGQLSSLDIIPLGGESTPKELPWGWVIKGKK